jgi:DNA polymerase-1
MSIEFNKMNSSEEGTAMIVDCLNLGFRWKHSGDHNFLESYKQTIESLKKSYKAQYVILTCDSGSSSYRKNIYPLYKQNRKDKYETQTPEEQKAFEIFFNEFHRVMENYELESNYPVLRFNKCEADDIGAYIVKKRKKLGLKKIVLISSDKDWDLLINPDVMRFSYVTRKEVTWSNWSDHYDYPQEHHINIKCLMGDTGDNIPGIEGVGPKKAQTIVENYGSVIDIAEALPIDSRYKYMQNLNSFGSDALLTNYKLMDLLEFCEDALGPNNCEIIERVLNEYIN